MLSNITKSVCMFLTFYLQKQKHLSFLETSSFFMWQLLQSLVESDKQQRDSYCNCCRMMMSIFVWLSVITTSPYLIIVNYSPWNVSRERKVFKCAIILNYTYWSTSIEDIPINHVLLNYFFFKSIQFSLNWAPKLLLKITVCMYGYTPCVSLILPFCEILTSLGSHSLSVSLFSFERPSQTSAGTWRAVLMYCTALAKRLFHKYIANFN